MESLILFEDNSIIVVNKPSGIPVQTDKIGEKDLLSILRNHLKEQKESPEIYPVHRLDQPVSGLLVLAKTREAAAALSKDLSSDSFSKDYRAKVFAPSEYFESRGVSLKNSDLNTALSRDVEESDPGNSMFELKDYLLKQKDNTSRVVPPGTGGAREAVLTYKVESTGEDSADLLVHLKTGRHHQIRVQLSHAGLPILGDRKYGTKESIAVSERLGIKTIALTSYRLRFKHPVTGKLMEYEI